MDSSFIERKDTILNALVERKGMQYLTDVASTTLRNPMMLFDISGKVLAVSRRHGDDLIWEQLLPEGHLKEEYTRLTEAGGTFAQLLGIDEPVISKPVFCPYRVMDKKYVSSKLIDSIRSLVGGNDTRIGISRPFRSILEICAQRE